jgi:hypothetical protein
MVVTATGFKGGRIRQTQQHSWLRDREERPVAGFVSFRDTGVYDRGSPSPRPGY